MDNQISVITSAYNAEKTIARAIESILAQTYQNFEMVVVNDCSTDKTAEIVKSYAAKDARIRLINHDVNKGAGLARRTGIENMRGEYMTFLDSDDYLKPDCLERLHDAMVRYNVDIVAPGFISVEPSGKAIEERIPDKVIQVEGAKFKPNKQDTKRFMNPMLIKSSLWDKVTYSSRRYIEDTPTLVQILYWAEKILLLDYAGYYYVQNPTSLIHSASKVKHLVYMALCAKDIHKFFNEHLPQAADIKHFLALRSEVFRVVSKRDREVYKHELQELKDYNK